MSHTPGPWGYEATSDYFEIAPVSGGGLDWSNEVACTANSNEADARLIAAAPDLLAACRAVAAWRDGPEGPEMLFNEGAKMIQLVRAAIAKAEGAK